MYRFVLGCVCLLTSTPTFAADAPRRVLLVTHAGGFMHDSLLTAEQVLGALGPHNGYALTCYRFTADPDRMITVDRKEGGQTVAIEANALADYSARFEKMMGEPVGRDRCGRINAATLKNFDAVIFFTTSTWRADRGSHPLTTEELNDLIRWVNDGGAFVAVHCGSDTLHDTLHDTPYGELVGGTFGGHPWVQNVRLRVEDPKHPAARGFADGAEIFDEIYQFGLVPNHPDRVPYKVQPYSRKRLHVILSVDNASLDVTKGSRDDGDYPVAWCQAVGRGRSFYTSLGHHPAVWRDERFEQHVLGGLKWALGDAEGDSTPSAELKTAGK